MRRGTRSSPLRESIALSGANREAVYRKCDYPEIALKAKPLIPDMCRLRKWAKRKVERA